MFDKFAKLTKPELAGRRCLGRIAATPHTENEVIIAELAYQTFKKIKGVSGEWSERLSKMLIKMRKCESL